MGPRDFRFILFSFIFSISQSALATKILLLTDQISEAKAKEVKELFLKTQPFSDMQDLEIVIQQIDKSKIQCRQTVTDKVSVDAAGNSLNAPDSCRKMFEQAKAGNKEAKAGVEQTKRNVVCTLSNLIEVSGAQNADRTILIKESNIHGGTGGNSITMTTASPATTAIHEILHSVGFQDEYGNYSTCEADIHCPHAIAYPAANLAVFEDLAPYSSDAEARAKHSKQIPWYGQILASTMITMGNQLGTPNKNAIGLHQVAVCDLATKKVKSWRPGGYATVMEDLKTAYIPQSYWPIIVAQLNSRSSFGMPSASGKGLQNSQKGAQ